MSHHVRLGFCASLKESIHIADGHTVVENTGSLLTSEVKRHRARLVLGWGTAWADLWVLSDFRKRLPLAPRLSQSRQRQCFHRSHFGSRYILGCCACRRPFTKADSTLRSSQAVPHPSTNRALCRLTSEVRRDPVHSTRYGRQRHCQSCHGFEFCQARLEPTSPHIGLRCRRSPTCTLSQHGYGA